jgi:hypothetical protein
MTSELGGHGTERMTSRKSGVKEQKLRKANLHFVFECERDKQAMMDLCPKYDIAHKTTRVAQGIYDRMFSANAPKLRLQRLRKSLSRMILLETASK